MPALPREHASTVAIKESAVTHSEWTRQPLLLCQHGNRFLDLASPSFIAQTDLQLLLHPKVLEVEGLAGPMPMRASWVEKSPYIFLTGSD